MFCFSLQQSDPTFVPIKFPELGDKSSGTESDDSSVKSVRFSKLAEVSISFLYCYYGMFLCCIDLGS